MTKAKEYLYSKGLIASTGKGRMSAAHHQALQDAYDAGERFSNWSPANVALMVVEETKAGETTERVVAKRLDAPKGGEGYSADGTPVEIAPYRYTEDEFHAVEVVSGKPRSLREVDEHCGLSLVQCYCAGPSVVATNGQGHVQVKVLLGGTPRRTGNVWDK